MGNPGNNYHSCQLLFLSCKFILKNSTKKLYCLKAKGCLTSKNDESPKGTPEISHICFAQKRENRKHSIFSLIFKQQYPTHMNYTENK